ncbi:hypothetical protein RchiOBHm_Chr1g0313811 [Rosa chinensis]|uniref:Uncharacterized protein n=1 Tax=Rosa chinensis TaxID=74649 RepID=A0A2P6S716_ROSCH|nr:hypothetical protein RchiOBHm_Chr1g0313811 [Rosa chinensis]
MPATMVGRRLSIKVQLLAFRSTSSQLNLVGEEWVKCILSKLEDLGEAWSSLARKTLAKMFLANIRGHEASRTLTNFWRPSRPLGASWVGLAWRTLKPKEPHRKTQFGSVLEHMYLHFSRFGS